MPAITVKMNQASATATEGSVRGHVVNIDRPEAKGGTDTGAMGGELLLMSLGGCFMSNLLEAVRTREAAISDINIDVVGNLEGTPPRFTAIDMQISAVHNDVELLEKLVTISERSCIVANSIKGAIDLKFTILG
jgi:putative redox protein